MRRNLPVTQRRVPVKPDANILSTTDPKGRITYINDEFIEISGYAREELIGQPHNVIRHPDMPRQSIRQAPEEAAVERAEALYARLRKSESDSGRIDVPSQRKRYAGVATRVLVAQAIALTTALAGVLLSESTAMAVAGLVAGAAIFLVCCPGQRGQSGRWKVWHDGFWTIRWRSGCLSGTSAKMREYRLRCSRVKRSCGPREH